MTNSQHNDKKRNASKVMTTTNSQHNDKKWNASMGIIDSVAESSMDFLTLKSMGKLALKSPYKKPPMYVVVEA
jgi:hypothetical protein